ncbi:MAG: methionyl-tRNA formyltransferase [Euryarchaeota archaeon]|nr:methionyl-tRNA formyltransferase [Euryarchaeota archaeon]|tara:strand:+ start:12776 stop:13726 length:951 start_codon:yes stop_codon:yes gene_type:complete
MKLIFAGTPDFGKEVLMALINSNQKVEAVFTQPDRASGRGKKIKVSPVKQLALEKGIDFYQPKNLEEQDSIDVIKLISPDLIVVAAYGLIIPKKVLDIPKYGALNIHASLLPRWRGASPIEHSILSGDKLSGITLMQMTGGLDKGPIYETYDCKIEPKENSGSLEDKLIKICHAKLSSFLGSFENKKKRTLDQDDSLATYANKITDSYQKIRWSKETALQLDRRIRSLSPKLGAFTFLGERRIKVFEAEPVTSTKKLSPGELSVVSKNELIVGCHNGTSISILKTQVEGKNLTGIKEFISGYRNVLNKEQKFKSRI